MKIVRNRNKAYITFESSDWPSGIAKRAIALIKTIPNSKYYGAEKKWVVPIDDESKIMELYKVDDKNSMVDATLFDPIEWLNETFGPDEGTHAIALIKNDLGDIGDYI